MFCFFVNFVVKILLSLFFNFFSTIFHFIIFEIISLMSSLKRDTLISSTQQPNMHFRTKLLASANSVVACARQSASSTPLACCFSSSLLCYLSSPFPHIQFDTSFFVFIDFFHLLHQLFSNPLSFSDRTS
jgi:hypothetical protein